MSTTVKFITYNTHLFGGTLPGSLVGGQGYDDDTRKQKILNKLKIESPDIVCLQEVWNDDTRQWFIDSSSAQFIGHYYPNDNPGLRISSGLLVLSKHSLMDSQFTPFKAASGTDDWATKGFITTTVRRNDGKVLAHLLTTHTQANNSMDDQKSRRLQFNEIVTAIRHMQQNNGRKSEPIIVCGDFNVIGEAKGGAWPTNEYRQINGLLNNVGLEDAFRDVHSTDSDPFDPGYTVNILTNKLAAHFDRNATPKVQRLDYIYLNKAGAGIVIKQCDVGYRGWVYSTQEGLMNDSDHFPLKMKYEIE